MSAFDQHVALKEDGPDSGPLHDFLAEVDADLDQGMISPRVLNDPDLHQAELDRIFARCWVYVGHVSEIPSPGDYVTRYIGEDQFILVRDEEGEIRALLNNCVHRGSPVCRAEKGNSSHFRCPYHGWIYKNSGAWAGAPYRARAYRKLDSASWGLYRAPLVDSYQGLIFACLDPDAVPLREYLGDMCWYLDLMFGLNEQGMAVLGDPQRWLVPSNWKSGAENFVGDAYHINTLHRSVEEVGVLPSIDFALNINFHIAIDGGHGLIGNRGRPEFGMMGHPSELDDLFDLDRLDENQRRFVESRYGITGFTIFPNLSFIRRGGTTKSGELATFTCLRQWQPRGPGEFELWNWSLGWKAASPEFNAASAEMNAFEFGSAGIFEQDDTVAWRGGPDIGRSAATRNGLKLNLQMGLDEMSDYEVMSDWYGPGLATTTPWGEMNQRRWWKRWCGALSGGAG